MRTIPIWIDKVHDRSKTAQCIYDLCFNPDGSHLIVAAGQVVSVYNSANGSVIQTLKGHKDTIYSVAYSHDGSVFASGGADKIVIIWNFKLEPLLKYGHNDAIQCLEFNPVTNVLISCTSSDFSFWSVDQKSLQKFKTPSRINSCSWNSLGQYVALGLASGNVSIRNTNGEEKFFIEREGPPVWALNFSPRAEQSDILCVSDWSQKMTFYSIEDKEIARERTINFEALSLKYTPKGDYILTGGCNKQCILMNCEGVELGMIGKEQESWIWSCKSHPVAPFVVFGCQDGTLAFFQLIFSTVHHLYRERYAFRDNMTDVIVQHLLTNERVRIKCRDRINKIAVYKDRLAVLLPTKVVVYELSAKDTNEMHYQVKHKLTGSFDCNLLVVCSEHLVFCQEERLRCFTFDGKNVRQWTMNDMVRYIKVIGGAPGNEGLIVGLANGQVLKIHLNNLFAIPIMQTNSAILCLDLSLSKQKLAVVNEDHQCIVYDLGRNEILYQDVKTTGVAWNYLFDGMLCFSGQDVLSIRIDNCQPHQMRFEGLVLAAFGSKAYSLNGSNIVAVDIPASTPMYQCIDKQMYQAAYQIACLGVTENDWKALARAAIEASKYEIAIQAYARIKDWQHLELIYEFLENGEQNQESFIGDLLAYDGKFKEAARMYQKASENHKAVAMYSDMRMFDLAQEIVKSESSTDKKSLIRKKAEWAKNVNDPKAAAEIYLSAGDLMKAVDIAVENRFMDMLVDLAKKLDKIEMEALKKIADCFRRQGELENAVEVYKKLGEHENVLQVYVDTKNWESAFALVKKYPQFISSLYMPYARWLVENDKFVEAQKAFHEAGKPEEAIKVVQVLIENAVDENRFDDAGYYHWILSRQYLDLARIKNHRKDDFLKNFYKHGNVACIYYAYHAIQRYLDEPFTSYQPDALFNIARYLLHETKVVRPTGVAQFSILYSLAKQAENLGGFKIARQAFDAMQNLRIPSKFQDAVDLTTVMIKAKPYHDNEELLVMCYRCSSYSPLVMSTVSSPGNCCLNCRQPFVFSFISFEILPLIEFFLEEGISDEEAMKLLQSSNDSYEKRTSLDNDGAFQTLLIEDSSTNSIDLFTSTLIDLEIEGNKYKPVVVNRETLMSLDSNLVIVCQWPEPLRYRYYKNLLPDLQIASCSSCFKIFHADDYELEVLQKGFCPFCRIVPEEHSSQFLDQ